MKFSRYLLIAVLTLFSPILFASDAVVMISDVPYADDAKVKSNIRKECTALGTKLSSFTQSFGKKYGVTVELSDTIDTSKGKVLKVEITDAVSRGNGFIGHSKYIDIAGSLWENGKKVASFTASRASGGGFAGAYKGSCSVLGRCSKTLGKDIARWLKSPEDDAHLGD